MLLSQRDNHAAVLLALFGVGVAFGELTFAAADRFKTGFVNALIGDVLEHGIGTTLRQSEVLGVGTLVVGVAFD